MAGLGRLPDGNSNGSGRNGAGGGGGANYTSTSQSHGSNPTSTPRYTTAPRAPWPQYTPPNGATNNHALATAPVPPRPHGPHQLETAHSSTHLRVLTYHSSESDFHSPSANGYAQPNQQQYQYQPPTGGTHPHQTADPRSGPYDAIGEIRRDGAV